MIGFVPTAKTLHRQKIWFRDEPVERTSIMPLFDQDSQVKQLIIILPEIDDIYIVPWNPRLVKLGFWGSKQLRLDLAELKSYSRFNSSSFSCLYHYDPWWVLERRRFWRYRDLEQLRLTNCANKFEEGVMAVCFSRDLSELSKFMIEHGALNFSYRSAKLKEMTWRSGLSRSKSGSNRRRINDRITSQWYLDPDWNDWVKL